MLFVFFALAFICVCANAQEWSVSEGLKAGIIMDVCATSDDSVYAATVDNGVGTAVQHSTDGGKTFAPMSMGALKKPLMYNGLNWNDDKNGMVVGMNIIRTPLAVTNDGGNTWTAVKTKKSFVVAFTAIEPIKTSSTSHMALGTYTNDNVLLKSVDNGKTFDMIDYKEPNNYAMSQGSYPTDNTYYLAGGIFPTANSTNPNGPNLAFQRYQEHKRSYRKNIGVADNSQDTAASIMKTTDGGKTWTQVFQDDTFCMADISCWDENTCWATGSGSGAGTINGGVVIRTTDGGKTWDTVYSSQTSLPTPVHFISATEGWVGAGFQTTKFNAKGQFLHTVDGGKTWTMDGEIKRLFPLTFSFVNSKSAWATMIPAVQGAAAQLARYN